MKDVLVTINDWLWNPLVVLALGFGLVLTMVTRGLQVRRFGDMLRLITSKESSEAGVSSSQALMLTLSSRIGIGNITGVALAISTGGPGALFWMAVMGFLGGATAYVESTLAQIYKSKSDGQFYGGIPYYIEKGLKQKWLAVIAAVTAAVLYALMAPGVQVNTISASFDEAWNVSPWVTAVAVTGLLGFIIFGQRSRIVRFTDSVVPFMAIGFTVAAVVVIAINAPQVPGAVALVFRSAFGGDAIFGGIVGAAIAWGVRRALFSNVAGVGEGTYGAAAAEVSHPAKQGLVQTFSIYIDTLFMSMASGLMILVTGSYNVQTESGRTLATNVPGMEAGAANTQHSVETVFTGVGPSFVAVALAFFAFSCLVAFYYIVDTSLTYLTGGKPNPVVRTVARVAMLAMVFYGAVESADVIWAIGDVGYASLAWVNMVCIILLVKPALTALRDYDAQRKRGVDPTFDPVELGIRGADYWTHRGTIESRPSDPADS